MRVINLDREGNIIKDLSKTKFAEEICKEVTRILTEITSKNEVKP